MSIAQRPAPFMTSWLVSFLASVVLGTPVVVAEPKSASPHGASSAELPWAFRPLQSPEVPPVKNSKWPRQTLDQFLLAKLESRAIAPNPDTDRRTLLRRLSFDLVGLPPTQKELEAFVNDPDDIDQALARMVDKYLQYPQFGERWGRHWLDLARYADNTSRAWNAPLTYAWRYRDWVIDALNRDLPYDQFLVQQLAGDELPARTAAERRDQLIATGFLAMAAFDLQNLSYEQFKFDVIDDQIDVTTRAILGLSVSCARCHDHKYDTVTMHDYYALAGVFLSSRVMPGVAHQREAGEGYVSPSRLIGLPAADDDRFSLTTDIQLPPGIHSMNDYQDEWRSGKRDIRFTTVSNAAIGMIRGEPRDCEIRLRGEPNQLGDPVPRGDWRLPGLPPGPKVPNSATGRLELARWLVARDQPLTPRVYVNRVWQHLFGAGIVRTVDDFGVNAETPTHPELLDHLAWQFREEGWSTKKLIRTMVLSRAYRLSSVSQPVGLRLDPANTLHWRMSLRRLEIEPLRDALLEVAGRLELERPEGIQVAGIGGKSVQSQVRSLLPFSSPYRTVYLPVLRAKLPEEFSTFDFPDPCLLQGQRESTTVAPQALFFMNNGFVVQCARDAAERMLDGVDEDPSRVDWIYRRCFGRPATDEEQADALALVRSLQPAAADRRAEVYRWSTLLQALFASAEFRYLR